MAYRIFLRDGNRIECDDPSQAAELLKMLGVVLPRMIPSNREGGATRKSSPSRRKAGGVNDGR